MTINKFQGKTQEEAIAKAKEEFGERAVIMNIREVKPKGLFRAFKNSTFEVTAAMDVVDRTLAEFGGKILPVDSEQSAIFQCLAAGRSEDVRSLILKA